MKISIKIIYSIPSVRILFLDIFLPKAIDESKRNLAAESFPFRSETGFLSAKPNFFAFSRTS